jgi:hypothetical protein
MSTQSDVSAIQQFYNIAANWAQDAAKYAAQAQASLAALQAATAPVLAPLPPGTNYMIAAVQPDFGQPVAAPAPVSNLDQLTADVAAVQQAYNVAANWAQDAQKYANQAQQSLNVLKAQIQLGVITPDISAELNYRRPDIPVTNLGGYLVPADPVAIKAGIVAMANQLTLELQAGTINQAQYNQALSALKGS